MIKFSLVFFLLICSWKSTAQNPLDFECFDSLFIPCYWAGEVGVDNFFIDSLDSHSGKHSIKLRTSGNFSYLTQVLFYKDLIELYGAPANSSFLFKGWVKTDKEFKGDVFLWIRLENEDGPFDLVNSKPIGSTNGKWNQIESLVDIPDNTLKVYFGIGVRGQNEVASFDNFKLVLNGNEINPYMDIANMRGLERRLSKSLKRFNLNEEDSYFAKTLQNAEVIGIGDCSHGTSDFTSFKQDILEYITSNDYLVDLAIECDMSQAHILNKYVLGELPLDEKQLLTRIDTWIYQTKEFFSVLEWIKRFNSLSENKIRIWGFDLGSPFESLAIVEQFYLKFDKKNFNRMREFRSRFEYFILSNLEIDKPKVLRDISQFKEDFIREYDNTTPKAEFSWALRNLELLYYYFEMNPTHLSYYDYLFKRDKYMAENIVWITNQFNAENSRKLLVWAHNGHVSKLNSRMGNYLMGHYGDSYKAFASLFFTGIYKAKNNRILEDVASGPPYPGSIEYAVYNLKMVNEGMTFIPLKKFKFKNRMFFIRNIGSAKTFSPYFLENIDQFDVLLFFNKTRPISSVF